MCSSRFQGTIQPAEELDMITIADEVDSQLKQAMFSYSEPRASVRPVSGLTKASAGWR